MIRAPTVRSGQPLRASIWNQLAGAVNGAIAGPRDLTAGQVGDRPGSLPASVDPGQASGEVGTVLEREIGRTVASERVKNPDDASQYVDVEHVTSITLRGSDGRTRTVYYAP